MSPEKCKQSSRMLDELLLEDKVDLAVDLNRQIKALQKKLENVKEELIVAAEKLPKDEKGNVVIRSGRTDNAATIVTVDPKPEIKKIVNVEEFAAAVSENVFKLLFEREYKFRYKIWTQVVSILPQHVKDTVLSAIEWVPREHRVLLSK